MNLKQNHLHKGVFTPDHLVITSHEPIACVNALKAGHTPNGHSTQKD